MLLYNDVDRLTEAFDNPTGQPITYSFDANGNVVHKRDNAQASADFTVFS